MSQQKLITETKEEQEKKTDNKLAIIIEESGLVTEKAKILLDNFSNYFDIAATWEKQAKTIVVTDASQIPEMKMARTGRLFLREKRIAIERTRKELKEQSLREGKAIDGIANVLKAVIIPVEEYLEKQEKFIEIKAAEEAERMRIEAEKKAEEDRIVKEKAEAAERERIRKENEQLRKEAEEKEKAMVAERARARAEQEKQQKIIAEQKAKAEAERIAHEKKIQEERAEAEQRAKAERDRQAKVMAEQKAKADAEKVRLKRERIAYEKRVQAEKEEADRKVRAEREQQEKIIAEQKARAKAELDSMIECPFCHKLFGLKNCKKTYTSEVDGDGIKEAQRQGELGN